MNNKAKKAGYSLLHYLIAAFAFWLHAFFISPALWRHGSSSAFEVNMGLWIGLLLWIGFLGLPVLLGLKRFYRKMRGVA